MGKDSCCVLRKPRCTMHETRYGNNLALLIGGKATMANDIQQFVSPLVKKLQNNRLGVTSIACAILLVLCSAISLRAQIRSGTITGIVTDPKGAVIVGAQVTVTATA